jgi:hypothetical protein
MPQNGLRSELFALNAELFALTMPQKGLRSEIRALTVEFRALIAGLFALTVALGALTVPKNGAYSGLPVSTMALFAVSVGLRTRCLWQDFPHAAGASRDSRRRCARGARRAAHAGQRGGDSAPWRVRLRWVGLQPHCIGRCALKFGCRAEARPTEGAATGPGVACSCTRPEGPSHGRRGVMQGPEDQSTRGEFRRVSTGRRT